VTIHKEVANSPILSDALMGGTDPFDGPEAPPRIHVLLMCARCGRLCFVVPLASGGNFESSEEPIVVVVVLTDRNEGAH
jgi:hypothetical protein